jgi:Bifunctional DNA primase/polymerase, N-terminal
MVARVLPRETNLVSESAVDLARDYLRRGWQPVPVPYREKAPTIREWQNLDITEDNVGDYFDQRRQNIGVQMGARSAGLTDVDLDCPEALALAEAVLPRTAAIFGRDSKPGSHRLYITGLHASEQKATIQFAEPTALSGGRRVMLAELRIGGNDSGVQTIFPGSTHPSGEAVRWENDGEPATVNGLKLKNDLALLAAGALLVRHYPSEGQRHEAALVLGGMLARRPDTTADQINEFVTAIARAAADEESEKRGRSASGAVQLFASGQPTPGVPRMREVWGVEVTDTVAKWLEIDGDPIGRAKASQADNQTGRLIALAGPAKLFHSPEGIGYADVIVRDHRET